MQNKTKRSQNSQQRKPTEWSRPEALYTTELDHQLVFSVGKRKEGKDSARHPAHKLANIYLIMLSSSDLASIFYSTSSQLQACVHNSTSDHRERKVMN